MACFLATQDNPERGLCRNTSAAPPHALSQEVKRTLKTAQSSSIGPTSSTSSASRHNPSVGGSEQQQVGAPGSASQSRSSQEGLDNDNSTTGLGTAVEGGQSDIAVAENGQARKDPKSFTQNLFDTVALRMVEWLPLRRATGASTSMSDDDSDRTPAKARGNSQGRGKRVTGEVRNSFEASGLVHRKNSLHSKDTNPSAPMSSVSSPTLEVRVPGQSVKRLSLGELEPWKQSQRSIADDRPKHSLKQSQKITVNSTPTSTTPQPIQSPPALKPRQQKHRRVTNGNRTSSKYHDKDRRHTSEISRELSLQDTSTTQTSVEATPHSAISAGQKSNLKETGTSKDAGHAQSLSHLSKDLVDGLERIMFESEEDEEAWGSELADMELRVYAEQWDWKYATHRQRQAFPFVAQSIFYSLSNPSQLLLSFSAKPVDSLPHNARSPLLPLDLDLQNLEDSFRKLYRISPWESTVHYLWACIGPLFSPPRELYTPTRHSRNSAINSVPPLSSIGHEQNRADEYVSDRDAAYITVIALFALASSIPRMDWRSWEIVRRVRSSGTVLNDFEIRKHPAISVKHLIDAADKFEHDLPLRLMYRLTRMISARKAYHEISKAKGPQFQDVLTQNKSALLEMIIATLQRLHTTGSNNPSNFSTGEIPAERSTNISMVIVEWLRTLFLKEWEGKPHLSKSSTAGGALQLLSTMYRNRMKLGLEPEDFHTSLLSQRFDPMEMPVEWLATVTNNQTTHLLAYSFMFPPSALVHYFRSVNYASMIKHYEGALTASRHITQMTYSTATPADDFSLASRTKTAVTTFLVLTIRREDVMLDAINQLWRREKVEFLRPLKVQMGRDEGEEGVDQGGIQQEFFHLVMLEALGPSFGMFAAESRSGMLWFQPCSPEPLYKFELIGLLISIAVYNGLTLPVNFPIALYRKLLGFKVKTTDHIRDGWPDLAKGFDDLLSWEDGDVGDVFVRTYEFSFDAFGTVVSVDMERTGRDEPWPAPERHNTQDKISPRSSFRRSKKRGLYQSEQAGDNSDSREVSMLCEYTKGGKAPLPRDAPVVGILKGSFSKPSKYGVDSEPQPEASLVTNRNRAQYVRDYMFWLTDKSVRPQYEAFARGFFTCLDRTALSLFNPDALKTVIEGIQEIDMEELHQYAKYEGGFHLHHPTVQDFWHVVKRYPQAKRGKLLSFVTSSDRLPVNGIPSILFVLQRNGVGDDVRCIIFKLSFPLIFNFQIPNTCFIPLIRTRYKY